MFVHCVRLAGPVSHALAELGFIVWDESRLIYYSKHMNRGTNESRNVKTRSLNITSIWSNYRWSINCLSGSAMNWSGSIFVHGSTQWWPKSRKNWLKKFRLFDLCVTLERWARVWTPRCVRRFGAFYLANFRFCRNCYSHCVLLLGCCSLFTWSTCIWNTTAEHLLRFSLHVCVCARG